MSISIGGGFPYSSESPHQAQFRDTNPPVFLGYLALRSLRISVNSALNIWQSGSRRELRDTQRTQS